MTHSDPGRSPFPDRGMVDPIWGLPIVLPLDLNFPRDIYFRNC